MPPVRKDISPDLWNRALQLAIGSFRKEVPDPQPRREETAPSEEALFRLVDRWIDRGRGGNLDYLARNAVFLGLFTECGLTATELANEVWLLIRLRARAKTVD